MADITTNDNKVDLRVQLDRYERALLHLEDTANRLRSAPYTVLNSFKHKRLLTHSLA